MLPEKIDSLADDVKPLVLELLRQNSGLTARVDELVAQNKALLVRIAELEAEHGKPPKTPDNSSLLQPMGAFCPSKTAHIRCHPGAHLQFAGDQILVGGIPCAGTANLTEKKRLILSFSAYLNNLTKPLKMRRNMK
jgi:hypothetical protein